MQEWVVIESSSVVPGSIAISGGVPKEVLSSKDYNGLITVLLAKIPEKRTSSTPTPSPAKVWI
jgi:hypothetical protein